MPTTDLQWEQTRWRSLHPSACPGALSTKPDELSRDPSHGEKLCAHGTSSQGQQKWWQGTASWDTFRTHALKGHAEVTWTYHPPAQNPAGGRGAGGPAPAKPAGHQPCRHPTSTKASFPNLAAVLGCSSHPPLDK